MPGGGGVTDSGAVEQRLREALERGAELDGVLSAAIVVEQATGVIAERYGLPIEEASELLRFGARSSRVPIDEIAHQIMSTWPQTPPALRQALAHEARWRAAAARERAEAVVERSQQLKERHDAQLRRLERMRPEP